MRKNIITGVSLVALSAGMAQAGGIELQTLDTSIMYADGNQIAVSHATIDASIVGYNPANEAGSKQAVVKDQTVTNMSAKFDVGENLAFGLTTYRSGAVQLSGGNTLGGNIAPTADVELNTTAVMANFQINENISVIGGFTQNNLKDGNVTTLAGPYDFTSTSELGYIAGVAYSVPEIALRAELTYQPGVDFSPEATLSQGIPVAAKLALPDSYALSFQTGIAPDTLLMASYRRANWSDAQIVVTVAQNPNHQASIETKFSDSESFSIGLGRKFSEKLSGSLTYSKEEGSGPTAESLFTVSNGSEAVSVGLQYKLDKMTLSGGISHRTVGDVLVTDTPGQMKYKGNSVTSFGLKIAFTF